MLYAIGWYVKDLFYVLIKLETSYYIAIKQVAGSINFICVWKLRNNKLLKNRFSMRKNVERDDSWIACCIFLVTFVRTNRFLFNPILYDSHQILIGILVAWLTFSICCKLSFSFERWISNSNIYFNLLQIS